MTIRRTVFGIFAALALTLTLACSTDDTVTCGGGGAPSEQDSKPTSQPTTKLKPYTETMPGSTAQISMVVIPAGGEKEPEIWMSATEITWDAFDIYLFGMDENGSPASSDAYARPSKPYIPPDRGFGHAGYPVISLASKGAIEFTKWLSTKTKKKYRLATEAEWERACKAGSTTTFSFGDDATKMGEYAWFKDNSNDKTQPVAQKKPNAWGLYDMHGNVSEWVMTPEGKPVTRGGNYKDEAATLTPQSRAVYTRSWQSTDPQVPKSKWWLSDGPFVGFRIVCEGEVK